MLEPVYKMFAWVSTLFNQMGCSVAEDALQYRLKEVWWPLASDVEPWSNVVRRSPKLVFSWAYSTQTAHPHQNSLTKSTSLGC